jgi:hypothetical protein
MTNTKPCTETLCRQAWNMFASQIPTEAPDAYEAVALEGTLHAEQLLAASKAASPDGARFMAGL